MSRSMSGEWRWWCLALGLAWGLTNFLGGTAVAAEADEGATAAAAAAVDADKVSLDRRGAVERGVAILQRGARNYPEHRECFSCHHQTLPILAMTSARRAGVTIDDALLKSQVEFTQESFSARTESLLAGKGIGGKGLTVGYGLWTFGLADVKPDDLTAAMATYLLKTQAEDGGWDLHAIRPPAEESRLTATVLAGYGLRRFGASTTGEPRAEIDASLERAKKFVLSAALVSQEDRVSRLWGAVMLGGSAEEVSAAREVVLKAQRDDGGWSQLPTMDSDAYATGLTLYVLQEAGIAATDPAMAKGLDYLTRTQHADGSWFVKTRAKPVQQYFDNGDPHGESQFLSMTATGWSVAALSRALPVKPAEGEDSSRKRENRD